jgi:uncharacterized protein YneF (UPF0154 family)
MNEKKVENILIGVLIGAGFILLVNRMKPFKDNPYVDETTIKN